MRNLKRALSLGLTAAMISGLMVMGSSAASSTYADVADTDNVEAIEVLKAVGIMVGDNGGNFNPDATVSRNEMAVVMSNLMAYNVATYKDTSPFTDVPQWAEPYVAACYTNGITAGYNATTYGGSDSVTTAQAALMIMKALGYFQYQSDFGSDWQLSTVAQGNRIDLFDDVDSPVKEAMTRNDLAQLVLNALEAGTVEAEKTGQDISVGDIVITSGVSYKFVTSGRDYATAINKNESTSANSINSVQAPIVELGEKLYQGDLTKEEVQDAFGRPATQWEYQAKEIGTYADEADTVFTSKVTSKALYDAVGRTATGSDYTWYVSVNGDPVAYDGSDLYNYRTDNDKDFAEKAGLTALTGNGTRTEVFVDGTADEESVHVSVIYSYAAEVLKVDEDDGTITLADLDNGPAKTSDTYDTDKFEEDDIVIYTYSNSEKEIQDVYAAKMLEGEVTRVRSESSDGEAKDGDNFVLDGTTYNYNKTMTKSERLTSDAVSNDIVAYLDQYGYVSYIDESAVTYDYAYVLTMGTDGNKYDNSTSDKGTTVYARLILTDGTQVKAETDLKASDADGKNWDGDSTSGTLKDAIARYTNRIVSYSVDKDGIYSLTIKDDGKADKANLATDVAIENGKASFKAYDAAKPYSANSNTIFIVVDPDERYDDYEVSVYTGIKNVPDIDADPGKTISAVALDNKGAVAKVVYVEDGEVSGTDQVIFAVANEKAKVQKDKEEGSYFEISAFVNGEIQTLNVKDNNGTAAKELVSNVQTSILANVTDSNGKATDKYVVALKSLTENSNGFYTGAKLYGPMSDDSDNDGALNNGSNRYVTGTQKAEDGTVGLGKDASGKWNYYAYSDDVVVARWDLDDQKIVSSRINSVKDDTNDVVVAIMEGKVVVGLFIIEVEGGEEAPSNDYTATNVKMFGIPVEKGEVTVPGSANGAGAARLTFDLPAGATLQDVSYRTNTSSNWTSWGTDYTLTLGLSQPTLYVQIKVQAADGTVGTTEFKATLQSSYTMTIDNNSSAAVRVSVGDKTAETVAATSGTTTAQVGAEGVTVTIRVSGNAKVDVSIASNAQVWDNGDGTYEISDVTGPFTLLIEDTAP